MPRFFCEDRARLHLDSTRLNRLRKRLIPWAVIITAWGLGACATALVDSPEPSAHPVREQTSAHQIDPNKLRTGDVVLISIPCSDLCRAIEIEEDSPFSHLGMAVVNAEQDPRGKTVEIVHVLGKGLLIESLDRFLAYARTPTADHSDRTRVKRFIEFQGLQPLQVIKYVRRTFGQSGYDDEFLWDNWGPPITGNPSGTNASPAPTPQKQWEKVYCSELLAKTFNSFRPEFFKTKPMHFTHPDVAHIWTKYYQGLKPSRLPPEGLPGISPGDFGRDPRGEWVF